MKLLPVVILFFVITTFGAATSAQEVFNSGGRFQALAESSTSLTGPWSVYGNQAGLAALRHVEVGGSFQNRFLVNELSSRSGLFAIPVQDNIFAVSYCQFGKIPFSQDKMGLAYARQLGNYLRFGLQFNRYGLYLAEENKSVFVHGLEVGIQYVLKPDVILGIHLTNPYQTRIKLSSETYRYESRINVGAFFQLSGDFGWALDFENRFDTPVIVKSGFEYEILKSLIVRAGVSGKPYSLSAGFGFRVGKAMVDFATSYNQYLGTSPCVSFRYQIR